MPISLAIRFLLISLTLSTATQDFPAIYGPVVSHLESPPTFIYSSADAMTLFASFNQLKASEIYANTGHGF